MKLGYLGYIGTRLFPIFWNGLENSNGKIHTYTFFPNILEWPMKTIDQAEINRLMTNLELILID